MNGWLIGIIAYGGVALATLIPVIVKIVQGVSLHPGGSSFSEANPFSDDAKKQTQWRKIDENNATSAIYSILEANPEQSACGYVKNSRGERDSTGPIVYNIKRYLRFFNFMQLCNCLGALLIIAIVIAPPGSTNRN